MLSNHCPLKTMLSRIVSTSLAVVGPSLTAQFLSPLVTRVHLQLTICFIVRLVFRKKNVFPNTSLNIVFNKILTVK